MAQATLQFIGATGTVTGSKYLLSVDSKNYLIDCGLFQGLKVLRLRNREPLPVDPKDIEAVILTHAHIDHSGYLPLLVKNGFCGKIYATPATHALCDILLPDAGYLQEEDAAFANKHRFSRHAPALPLYTEKEAREALHYFEEIPWDQKIALSKELALVFREAGHILGASFAQLSVAGRLITFSGDLGRPNTLTMHPPKTIHKTDYLVVESTYGNRVHPKEDPKIVLEKIIDDTIKKGGALLIPSFAVGRTQQILFLLSQLKKEGKLNSIPIYVNSPMATEATRIFCEFDQEQALTKKECTEMFQTARFVTTVEQSKALNATQGPTILIAASGMATGGRILHHLKFLAPNAKNTILFTGFQAAGTRGEALLHGAAEIKIHGETIPVRAKVEVIHSLSAHADQVEIMAWLGNFTSSPKRTFITHGEPMASETLRKKIEQELHWTCEVPEYLETFTLS